MIDPDNMLSASCILVGVWGMLNAAQWFAGAEHWRAGKVLGWDLQGLRASRLYGGPLLIWAFAPRAFAIIRSLQLASSVLLCLLPIGWGAFAALFVIAVANALLIFRSSADGADKMAMVVISGLMLQMLGANTAQPLLFLAGVLWVGCQLTLCYATSGFGKLILAGWRHGTVPRNVLSSYMYGNQVTHVLMKHRTIALTLAWGVILLEALFPVALFTPLPVLIAVLCGTALLHFSIAFAMGLNTYVFAFISGYPSVLLLAQYVQSINWINLR